MKKTLAFFAASAMLAASSPAALTDWKLQEKEEIRLEISESAAAVVFYVDGPFRCSEHGGKGIRFDHDPRYEVQYDFELKVPRTASLVLKTVNGGIYLHTAK